MQNIDSMSTPVPLLTLCSQARLGAPPNLGFKKSVLRTSLRPDHAVGQNWFDLGNVTKPLMWKPFKSKVLLKWGLQIQTLFGFSSTDKIWVKHGVPCPVQFRGLCEESKIHCQISKSIDLRRHMDLGVARWRAQDKHVRKKDWVHMHVHTWAVKVCWSRWQATAWHFSPLPISTSTLEG